MQNGIKAVFFLLVQVRTWNVKDVLFAVAYLFNIGSVLHRDKCLQASFFTLCIPVLLALSGGTSGPLCPHVQSLGQRVSSGTEQSLPRGVFTRSQ